MIEQCTSFLQNGLLRAIDFTSAELAPKKLAVTDVHLQKSNQMAMSRGRKKNEKEKRGVTAGTCGHMIHGKRRARQPYLSFSKASDMPPRAVLRMNNNAIR